MNIDPDKNPLDKLPPVFKKDLDENLCACNDVLEIDVAKAIVNGAKTVEELQKQTCATDGSAVAKDRSSG